MKTIISLLKNSRHSNSLVLFNKYNFEIFNYETHAVMRLSDNISLHWDKDDKYFLGGFKHSLGIGLLQLRENCRFRVDWKHLFNKGHFNIRFPFLYLMKHNSNLHIGNNTFYINFDLHKIRRRK